MNVEQIDLEIISVLQMNLPKDCKQIIIGKIKEQYEQEKLYLKNIYMNIEFEYLEEMKINEEERYSDDEYWYLE